MELLRKFYQCICCISNPVYPNPYQFQFNPRNPPKRNQVEFQSNFVKTSKYNWYDFFIKALLLQFKRLANVYFLIISIILTIPQISPLSPVSSWTPLIFVLLISILRQGYEDYQRHVSDRKMNFQSQTQVLREGKFITVEWSKVLIGDIVKVTQEDFFPSDLILLASSSEGGIAFIETASLDGQKNLKPRNAYNQTNKYIDQNLLQNISGRWFGTLPDKQLHKFSSKMRLDGLSDPLIFEGDKQLLYRGARLKNTKFIIGLSIYTGKNTKIMINSESSSVKMSQIQDKVNYILAIILLFQVVLSIITAILHGIFRNNNQAKYYYIDWSKYSNGADAVLMFFVYFVLINTMIPISLIVSIEIVKMCQSYFIMKDQLMYSKFRNKFVQVKSASLNQQLGQIQYVFSDKTGTLTMNLMEFKIACIGQNMYGDLGLISKDPNAQVQTQKGFHDDKLTRLLASGQGNGALSKPITIQGGSSITFNNKKQLAQEYLQLLGLAHECVAQTVKGKLIYQGPSPDQIALVDAAKLMDFQFIRSTKQETTIKIRGQLKTVQLLQVFPFNSDRKRMSVIIKEKGVIKIYTKGADSIVKQRLSPKSQLNLDSQLTEFSKIGLRTLLVAMKTVTEQQYQSFRQKINQIPPGQNRTQKYNQIVNQLEQGFFLIGATAVLDRLQDDVPQTIRDLIRANIKVWMLTGDKMQTAQNIAKSCKLIQDDFRIFRYQGSEKQRQIQRNLSQFIKQAQSLSELYKPKALLIEGSDLTPILKSQIGRTSLSQLAKYCEAVVCCRLLPLQKAEVVALVRQKLNKITLAIGDGANDVPMIKTAHIGIGLFGQQGMGAVQSSDYALPQFRMLWRLLLVHGRWNYIRISEMILYFFYKNMIFTIPQYLFAFFCGYSGQTLYDDFYITLYNLIFTSIPLVVRAILEQDVNFIVKKKDTTFNTQPQSNQHSQSQIGIIKKSKPLQITKLQEYLPPHLQVNKFLYRLFPKVYFIGQQNAIFNYSNYFLWVAEGILESIMIFLFCIYSVDSGILNQNGYNGDMWIIGLTVFSAAIVVVTFKLSTHTKFWSVFLFVAVSLLSLAFYVSYMWISNYKLSEHVQGTTYVAWTTAECYFLVLICLVFVLTIDGVVLAIDYSRGGYISKIRQKIDDQKINSDSQFADTLAITSALTQKKQ